MRLFFFMFSKILNISLFINALCQIYILLKICCIKCPIVPSESRTCNEVVPYLYETEKNKEILVTVWLIRLNIFKQNFNCYVEMLTIITEEVLYLKIHSFIVLLLILFKTHFSITIKLTTKLPLTTLILI